MFVADDNGLNFGIGSRDGFTAIVQIGWSPELSRQSVPASTEEKNVTSSTCQGMPGHYWFGVTYSQWDLYPRFGGGFEFVASGYYPQKEISIVPFQVNIGFNYKGLFPSRGQDHTMLHFIYGNLTRDYARKVRLAGGGDPGSEKVIEVAHRFQIRRWTYFQPNVQWVIDPGGTGRIPAVVIGAQMGLTF